MGSDSGGHRVPDCRRDEDRCIRAQLGPTALLSGRKHTTYFADEETGLEGPFPRLPAEAQPSSCVVLNIASRGSHSSAVRYTASEGAGLETTKK